MNQSTILKNGFGILLFISAFGYRSYAQDKIIKPNDRHIRYMGRMGQPTDSAATLCWTASSVRFNFYGSKVKAVMDDEDGKNYYDVIIDDTIKKILHLEKGRHSYVLCSGLKLSKHAFELFKRTEGAVGKTRIIDFQIDENAKLLNAPAVSRRKIEFYGNSITCGYGILDTAGKGSNGAPKYEDAYNTYASLTARYFNADYRCITKSGIGITISWFPLIMSEVYDRLYYNDALPQWDFSGYTPDIVVVNLFQNDSWLVKMYNHAEFKHRFGKTAPMPAFIINAYASFIKSISSHYPSAKIICALGDMDASKKGSPWFGYIQKAVASLDDKNIYTISFPYKGTGGHPNIQEHKAMADILTKFIEKNIKW